MIVAMIVAADRNGVIGVDGGLPWRLPDDLRWFRRMTLGKPVIMGRKTHVSIGQPLPGRHNIVLSRDPAYVAAGCTVVDSVLAALTAAGEVEEAVVIGGAAIYALFWPYYSRIYLTEVDAVVAGDTWLPPFERAAWRELSREHHPADARHACAFDHVVLARS